MQVLIFHNVTTVEDLAAAGDAEAVADLARDRRNGRRLAIFQRFGEKAPIEPGDHLRYVGELDLPADTAEDAAHAAYAAGNSPYEGDAGVTKYREWQVRSLSVGDVVVVYRWAMDKDKAPPVAYAVAGCGFDEIDAGLAAYEVEIPQAFRRHAGQWQRWVTRDPDAVLHQGQVW